MSVEYLNLKRVAGNKIAYDHYSNDEFNYSDEIEQYDEDGSRNDLWSILNNAMEDGSDHWSPWRSDEYWVPVEDDLEDRTLSEFEFSDTDLFTGPEMEMEMELSVDPSDGV